MISDFVKAIRLYPRLYQARMSLLFFPVAILLSFAYVHGADAATDLSLGIYWYAIVELQIWQLYNKLDYSSMMATSVRRKNIAVNFPAVMSILVQMLLWGFLMLIIFLCGRMDLMTGPTGAVIAFVWIVVHLLMMCIYPLSGRFNRMVTIVSLIIVVLFISAFFFSAEEMGWVRWFDGMLHVTMARVTLIVFAGSIVCAVVMRIVLGICYRRPIRQAYLDALKG